MNLDPIFARTVMLPFVRAAYAVTTDPTQTPPLPAGFAQTALLKVDTALATELIGSLDDTTAAPVRAMTAAGPVFGLMGHNTATQTAVVALRGTHGLEEWLADLDTVAEPYRELPGFGDVHAGFQAVYQAVQDSLRAGLPPTCVGCTRLLVTGHSLGAAITVLAAPDMLTNMPPKLEPQLVTFGGPRVGLPQFAEKFNATIGTCVRIVNFLDIVPAVPLPPYTHVGTLTPVDSGGSINPITRHSLDAYDIGLAKLSTAAIASTTNGATTATRITGDTRDLRVKA